MGLPDDGAKGFAGRRPIDNIHPERQRGFSKVMLKRGKLGQGQWRFANNGEVQVGVGLGGKSGARPKRPYSSVRKMTSQDFRHDCPMCRADFDFRQRMLICVEN